MKLKARELGGQITQGFGNFGPCPSKPGAAEDAAIETNLHGRNRT